MIPVTPMMRQYKDIKKKHGDALLFFRVGDFYEMFYDDAKTASKVLGITLTSRSKGDNAVPMAGVPHHSAHTYIHRLIKAGYKVAICDQMEDPEEAKGVVERDVTRIITPGTLTDDLLLKDKDNNYLLAIFANGESAGLSWVDLSTGKFQAQDIPTTQLIDEFARLRPSECLLSEEMVTSKGEQPFASALNAMITPLPGWVFARDTAYQTLKEHFGTASLEGFGCESLGPSINAAGAVIHYLKETQRTSLKHISKIERFSNQDYVILDRTTQQCLELLETMRTHEKDGSLLGVLDQTLTSMGGRLLKQWIISPLKIPEEIRYRQDGVRELFKDSILRNELREMLKGVYDIERISTKVSCARANARDLVSLKQSLAVLPKLKEKICTCASVILKSLGENLDPVEEVRILIGTAIVPDPPHTIKDGGMIREGYDQDLDELHHIRKSGKNWIANFQAEEIKRTGINSLKVGYNRVFGYYIEITNTYKDNIPQTYIRKQTLKNAERYITPELKDYETKVLTADERAKELEYDIFGRLREEVSSHTKRLQKTAEVIATLDVISTLAHVAAENGYGMPEITDGLELNIIDGRHPVLDKIMDNFVPNDVAIDGAQTMMVVITGPNMAGKSTYIRQVALLVLMAQMGSFIPAKQATIGVVDRIFTRVGASDELASGQSTFMVEMNETANILNNATNRSLIVLDEVGRGTSTFDGLSIAWAITEYIYEHIKARTLFATHYHELTEIELLLPCIKNYNIAVKEWGDEIIFLRKIVEGGADKSYGIHVARLAGIPREVLDRAKTLLANLEANSLDINNKPKFVPSEDKKTSASGGPAQLSIFAPKEEGVLQSIKELDIPTLTPLDALNKLNELKKKLST
ncbi:MAG TPA: DNA mismatch repair protein MutS [Candidatus Brocadiia bacterium]|nr:DNA mismatch repair protein MutS [Candidatus Brocadiales bacterium]